MDYKILNDTIKTFLMSYGIDVQDLVEITDELVDGGVGRTINLIVEQELPTNNIGPLQLIMDKMTCNVNIGIFLDQEKIKENKYDVFESAYLDIGFRYRHTNGGSNGKSAEFVVITDGFDGVGSKYHVIPRASYEASRRVFNNKLKS